MRELLFILVFGLATLVISQHPPIPAIHSFHVANLYHTRGQAPVFQNIHNHELMKELNRPLSGNKPTLSYKARIPGSSTQKYSLGGAYSNKAWTGDESVGSYQKKSNSHHGGNRLEAPPGWSDTGDVADDEKVSFHVALKNDKLERGNRKSELELRLGSISDPDSKNYGKFMTSDQIKLLSSPSDLSHQAVQAWLKSAGVTDGEITNNGDNYIVDTTAKKGDSLFSTQLHRFLHKHSKTSVVRASGEWDIPNHAGRHIAHVEGIHDFFPPPSHETFDIKPLSDVAPSQPITAPSSFSTLVDIPKGSRATRADIGIAQFGVDHYDPSDLATYETSTNQGFVGPSKERDTGRNSRSSATIGGNGGHEIAGGISNGGRLRNLRPENGGWLYEVLTRANSGDNLPDIIAFPQGLGEDHFCDNAQKDCVEMDTMPVDYQKLADREFIKLGLKGVTVLAASGDESEGKSKAPHYPATSAFVTSVGGAKYSDHDFESTDSGSELCSNNNCVQKATMVPTQGSFKTKGGRSFSGRHFPDVSFPATNHVVHSHSKASVISGSGAATSAAAGALSHAISQRKKKNGKGLGFINPTLDSLSEKENGFHNIPHPTTKNPGWNSATGHGVPQISALIKLVAEKDDEQETRKKI